MNNRFPVINGGSIPRSIAELAYMEYASRYGKSQSLDRLGERGGFHQSELDMFVPDWRKKMFELDSRFTELEEELTAIRLVVEASKEACTQLNKINMETMDSLGYIEIPLNAALCKFLHRKVEDKTQCEIIQSKVKSDD